MAPANHLESQALQKQIEEEPRRKLTRKERREFGRKLKKTKYQKIANRIIDQKK